MISDCGCLPDEIEGAGDRGRGLGIGVPGWARGRNGELDLNVPEGGELGRDGGSWGERGRDGVEGVPCGARWR
jgi:hypothetical protein